MIERLIVWSPEERQIVLDILRRHVPDRSVWIFGSRAKGTTKKTADLDLCIMGDEKVPPSLLTCLAEAFDESPLPFKVDLVEWNTLNGFFQEVIKRDGIPLHRNSQ